MFNKTVQQVCNTSLDAGWLVSNVAHNSVSLPSVHSNRSIIHVTIGNDIDAVKNSIQNSATNKTPGFESDGPGFESLIAGYESSGHETEQNSSGYVPRDLVVAKPTGYGFESSQVNDLVPSMNQEGKDSGDQNKCSVSNPDLTVPESVGLGFELCVKHTSTSCLTSVNAVTDKENELCPIYDVNNAGMEEKFVNTIIFANQGNKDLAQGVNMPIFNHWQQQVDFQFGFVPLGSQLIPSNATLCNSHDDSSIEIHKIVKKTGKPNFFQAHLPVTSQLNVDKWKTLLKDYWDQQLLQLLQFGFPLDFNRCGPLKHKVGNHSSANEFPADGEECKFHVNPIENAHNSPFMTRNKPNSDRRRAIIDLSWPLGPSVNSGIDKNTYLDAPFMLTFPTVDDIRT